MKRLLKCWRSALQNLCMKWGKLKCWYKQKDKFPVNAGFKCDTAAMIAAMLSIKLSETPCNGTSVIGIVVPVPIYAMWH